VKVQGLDSEQYAARGLDQRTVRVDLAAERGSIFDRNGNDLAISVAQDTVWADPRLVDDPAAAARALAPVLHVDEATLRDRLARDDVEFVYLARKVDDGTATFVRALDVPGVGLVPESKRFYPSGALAAGLLGMVGTDNYGLGGIEASYDELLTGRPGELVVERDPRGREIPRTEREVRPSARGGDLVLTIDQSLQYEVERVLVGEVEATEALGGTAIVIDVQTGEVLAMASVEGSTDDHPARPTAAGSRNSPVTDVYEPGSTNKVITVAGALESGLVTPDTVFQVPDELTIDGQEFSDVGEHPTSMTVHDIVRESSNVGTIMIARELGEERFDAFLRAFGFGVPTALDFPGESPGILLPVSDYNDTSMASMPIGNGIAVTAMQMLNVYAAIANGGVLAPPRLVAATIGPDGARTEVPVAPPKPIVSTGTADTLRAMLEAVVSDGTGTQGAVPGYRVAGKTGTARKPPYDTPPYKYVASFAGFAPADAPRIAAIVVLDEPQGVYYGGQTAAPVFARVMQYALRLERVPPSAVPAPSIAAGSVPGTE